MIFEVFALLVGMAMSFTLLFLVLVNANEEPRLSTITSGIIASSLHYILAAGSFIITVSGTDYILDWLPTMFGGIGTIFVILSFLKIYELVLDVLSGGGKNVSS